MADAVDGVESIVIIGDTNEVARTSLPNSPVGTRSGTGANGFFGWAPNHLFTVLADKR